jgi:hypothetical protein
MTAKALAEYLVSRPDEQEQILQNSRFPTQPVVTAYSAARKALRAYHASPARLQQILVEAKQTLGLRTEDSAIKRRARDEAQRCIEAIELFERGENAFGMRALALKEAPRFDDIMN